MAKTLTKDMTVGSMVAEDFKRAEVFEHLGIDYCCHGSDTLEAACAKQNLKPEDVLDRLDRNTETTTGSLDFSAWPLDLLLDYVLKKHHRNFHLHHEALMQLVEKVERAHGGRHPELHEVKAAVAESFAELDSHFAKEEQVLFPQLYEMYEAQEQHREAAPFHCGSIAFPIRQMMLEHDTSGEAWQHISALTEDFTTPADGCASYREMNRELYQFFEDLKEHISLENNLIFPGFLKMEQQPTNE